MSNIKIKAITVRNETFNVPKGYASIQDYLKVLSLNLKIMVGPKYAKLRAETTSELARLESVGIY